MIDERELHHQPTHASHKGDRQMNKQLQSWLAAHPIGDRMIWKGAATGQHDFVFNHLVPLVGEGRPAEEILSVVGSHRSKSIDLPVYQLGRADLGLRIILRDNFYNWKMSVITERPIHANFAGLFHTTPPVEPEYTGNALASVYFEGFPPEVIFGYYDQGTGEPSCAWSAELHGSYTLWVAVFTIMRALGAAQDLQGVPCIQHGSSRYPRATYDMMFARDYIGGLALAGVHYDDVPEKYKHRIETWPKFSFRRDEGLLYEVEVGENDSWRLRVEAEDANAQRALNAVWQNLDPNGLVLSVDGKVRRFKSRITLWATLFLLQRWLGYIKPYRWGTKISHRAELDAERVRSDARSVLRELLSHKVDVAELPKDQRERLRATAYAELSQQFDKLGFSRNQSEHFMTVVHAAAQALREKWPEIGSQFPGARCA